MSSDKFVHRLVLPSVRLSDAGEFTAVAGSSMSKGNLGVEGRDIKISVPARQDITVSPIVVCGVTELIKYFLMSASLLVRL